MLEVKPAASPHPTGTASRSGSPSPSPSGPAAAQQGHLPQQVGKGSGEGNRIRVLSVIVEDGPNTLTKVSGVIRRRGFHVRGISVGPSRQPGRSRITLEIDHGHAEADQVRKQLERLVEVLEVEDLTGDAMHSRELVVAKVAASDLDVLLKRGARILSTASDGTTVEFSGDVDEVSEFVHELARHGIVDVVRSGPVVMRRTE